MYNNVMTAILHEHHNIETEHLLADLLVAANRLTRVAASATGDSTSPAIWRTLSVLDNHGPMRLGELATETRISQPTATKIVQNLNELEWIKRIQDPHDARVRTLAVAPKGAQALKDWKHRLGHALTPLFGDLSTAEWGHVRATVDLIRQRVRMSEQEETTIGDRSECGE